MPHSTYKAFVSQLLWIRNNERECLLYGEILVILALVYIG